MAAVRTGRGSPAWRLAANCSELGQQRGGEAACRQPAPTTALGSKAASGSSPLFHKDSVPEACAPCVHLSRLPPPPPIKGHALSWLKTYGPSRSRQQPLAGPRLRPHSVRSLHSASREPPTVHLCSWRFGPQNVALTSPTSKTPKLYSRPGVSLLVLPGTGVICSCHSALGRTSSSQPPRLPLRLFPEPRFPPPLSGRG